MKHPISRDLFAYWNLCRGNSAAPDSGTIDPLQLGTKLVDTFLIRIHSDGTPGIRFCGSNIAARFGRDLTDESFLDLWAGRDRDAISRHLEALTARPAGFVAGSLAETAGGGFTAYEYTLLPLVTTSYCDRAIGCMVRIGGNDSANRLRIRILSQELRSARIFDPGSIGESLIGIKRSPLRSATDDDDFDPDPPILSAPSSKRFGHLYVVDGGK